MKIIKVEMKEFEVISFVVNHGDCLKYIRFKSGNWVTTTGCHVSIFQAALLENEYKEHKLN